MIGKTTLIAVVAVGCVVAAGVGGYLAVKFESGQRAEAQSGAAAPAVAPDAPAARSNTPAEPAASTPVRRRAAAPGRSAPAVPADTERRAAPPQTPEPEMAPPAVTPSVVAEPLRVEALPPPVTSLAEPPPAIEAAPVPRLEELTVAGESVVGIRLETPLSSATAKVEDRVVGRVLRDVVVDGRTAIAAGTRVEGAVVAVARGGKFKNPGRLELRFTTLHLGADTRLAITTEKIHRTADPPGNEATAKIGASAVVGAILGGFIGGKKGATIGGAAGAAGGTAAVAAGDANEVTLAAGTALTIKLTAPVKVVVERQQ